MGSSSGEAVAPVTIDTDIHSTDTANSSESDITELPPPHKDDVQKSPDVGLGSIITPVSHGLEPMDTATPPIPSPQDPNMISERDDVPMAEGSDRASVSFFITLQY